MTERTIESSDDSPRPRRRGERAIFIVSALLVISLTGLWARSYSTMDALDWRINFKMLDDGRFLWRHFKAWSSRGGLIVRWETHWFSDAQPTDKPLIGWITAAPGTHYDNYDPWEPLRDFHIDRG